MDSKYRKGACVPMEYIDPHKGSMLVYGMLEDWIDNEGQSCSRKKATSALVEPLRPLWPMYPWDSWAEEYAFIQNPFPDEDYKSPENVAARMKREA